MVREDRKKMLVRLMEDKLYVPMKEKELAMLLRVEPDDREELKSILTELISENKIQVTKRGKYKKLDDVILTGKFIGNQKGFGFVSLPDEEDDIFIAETNVNGAFHDDTVEVKVKGSSSGEKGRNRREGIIIRVIEHGIKTLVGTFEKSKNYGFVIPDNRKIDCDVFIAKEHSQGAVNGSKVVVRIKDYGSNQKNPEGIVEEIIGHIDDPGVDIMSIVLGYEIPSEFPEDVLATAQKIPDHVTEFQINGRRDFRNLKMITIDGEDSKDLDDAVSLELSADGCYLLGVHIADVSEYVKENELIDQEALRRGTSVYLADRVIPMLPHNLCNGICSLNEGEDRLALSCIMKINSQGSIIDYEITESIICTDFRMTYHDVKEILEDGESEEQRSLRKQYKPVCEMLAHMKELAFVLNKARRKRGSIDFDLPETKIIVDSTGKPTAILPYDRNIATRMIEEFMLAANETVATQFFWLEIPFLYRVHGVPDNDKMDKLVTFVSNFGYRIKRGQDEIHPKEIQKLLDDIEGTPEEALISRITLRSMQRAKYSPDCTGHYGLAFEKYCHFTSPIRRYPDLQIHRIIKEYLSGMMNDKRKEHYDTILDDVARQSSTTERRADEAERETDKLKKAQYMENYIGEYFDGVISGITSWGIYVELPNTIEGMIKISSINGDFFRYDDKNYELIGEQTGIVYRLGDRISIQVNATDRFSRTIDFVIAGNTKKEHADGKRSRTSDCK